MSFSAQDNPSALPAPLTYLNVHQTARSLMLGWAVILTVLMVASCKTVPSPEPTSTPKLVPTRLAAELFGKLVLVGGCLRVNPGYSDDSFLLIWPPEFDVRIDNDRIDISDRLLAENEVWHIGETVTLGGGEVHGTNDGERPLFSANCPGPYWIVGGIVVPPTVTPAVK